jgi:hypothetical protein
MALTKVTTGTIADDSIQSLKNRNLIINGAMQVAQRATQVTGVTTTGYYTCDRWRMTLGSLGAWTIDQSTDAPNGFSNSFKVTCTTADASPAANDFCTLYHFIEAQNLQHLGFGTTDAKSMTLSFWVKSNKTGSASFAIFQQDNSNKMISKSYTINSADTWEYKTISIPADTAGVINNDNGSGFQIEWWLNSGTNWSSGSLQSTWSTYGQVNRNPSNLGVGGAVNDYLAITGVQLEVGDVATPFEHESYGDTLAKCQRYYQKAVFGADFEGANSTFYAGAYALPVSMRATPTLSNVVYPVHISNINTSIGVNGILVLISSQDYIGWQTTAASASRAYGWSYGDLDAEL